MDLLWFSLVWLGILHAPHSAESTDPKTIIEAVNTAGSTWTAGENFDPATPPSYIKKLLGGRKPPKVTLPVKEMEAQTRTPLPANFDSRKKWPHCPTIANIYDQGACGSCWAVAGASTFSDRVCIASGGNFTGLLSAHQLLSCCGKMCGDGCDGGDDYRAWVYIRKYGIVTGGQYQSDRGCQPYTLEPCQHHHIPGKRVDCYRLPPPKTPECTGACTNPKYGRSYEQDHFKASKTYKVMSDPTEIMKEIMTHGPVQGGMIVYEDFPHYKSGVYKHVAGKEIGAHSIRIIGWGTEGITPYWLVANTWNTDWGDNGVFKILRGRNECGIEEAVHAGIPIV
uniref:Venom C1A protease 1 n=1 Tax=Lethocerus distinctifemur TaxID=280095 RepID=A0A2K8JL33_9HEMI|nr:venom C1A protease 1 [Lethocerus distinctifemur]